VNCRSHVLEYSAVLPNRAGTVVRARDRLDEYEFDVGKFGALVFRIRVAL
jgi:hypothetical protein